MLPRCSWVLALATGCAAAGSGMSSDDDDAPPIDASPDCTMQTFYRDSDGDGHGDRMQAMTACAKPDAFVPNSDDCDDASAKRFPGNTEVCDALDNDCNAITNDACPVGCTAVRRPPPDHEMYAYLVCNLSQAWPTARATCINAGFNLIRIDSADENTFVRSTANAAFGSGADIHIGGSDAIEGMWVWDGSDPFWMGGPSGTAVGGRYANWLSGEPNDNDGEDCAEMKPGGGWNDDDCGDGQRFICRK